VSAATIGAALGTPTLCDLISSDISKSLGHVRGQILKRGALLAQKIEGMRGG
jgi:hypothetical protein